jgi:hypothetical protein
VSRREDRERRMTSHFSGVITYRIATESVIKPRCNREVEGVKTVFFHWIFQPASCSTRRRKLVCSVQCKADDAAMHPSST